MRSFLIALLMIAGLSLATTQGASAAPASGAPIANALSQFDNTQAEPVAMPPRLRLARLPHALLGGAVYIAPRVVGPVCRSVRVCDWRGCFWRRRCF